MNARGEIIRVGIQHRGRDPLSRCPTNFGHQREIPLSSLLKVTNRVQSQDGLDGPLCCSPKMLMRHRKCQLTLLIPLVRFGRRWPLARSAASRRKGGEGGMLNNFVYRIPWTDATPSPSRETEQQRYWVKKT